MSSISWPIILSGDYSDGSVCSAADYRNDFYKLRDAVNQIYERFSSFMIYGEVRRTMSEAGSGLEHATISDTNFLAFSFWQIGDTDSTATEVSAKNSYRRNIVTLFKVPTWMQGLRIRGLSVQNRSNIPYSQTDDNVMVKWKESRPKFGVSVGDSTDSFYWADATTAAFISDGSAAIDIADITFGLGLASDTEAPNTAATGSTYTQMEELGGPNYMTGTTAAARSTAISSNLSLNAVSGAVYKEATCDYVVEPGQYIALWSSGDIKVQNETATLIKGPMILDYQITVLCDTMIPIP